MHLEQAIRLLAGALVLTGTILSITVNLWWMALVAFVGLNLMQSAVTGICPAEWVFKRLGLRHQGSPR